MIQELEAENITSDVAENCIYECFTTRWHALKHFPFNITLDNSTVGRDFFFEIASNMLDDQTPLCHLLMPGVINVIPDQGDGLIINTEFQPLPGNKEKKPFRTLLPELIYVKNDDGTEVLLDAKAIFRYALSDDQLLFEEAAENQYIKLTPRQIMLIELYYPDLYSKFWHMYSKKHADEFHTSFTEAIKALADSSSHTINGEKGKGTKMLAKITPEAKAKMKKFYDAWLALPSNVRDKYGSKICGNQSTLAWNLILLFDGTLMPETIDENKLKSDFNITPDDLAKIRNIFSCTGMMAEILTIMQTRILEQEDNLDLKQATENFNYIDKKNEVVANLDDAKLIINIMTFIHSDRGQNNELRKFITECLPTLTEKNFSNALQQALLMQYESIEQVFSAAGNDDLSLQIAIFIFWQSIAEYTLEKIKELITTNWQQNPDAAFMLAKIGIRAALQRENGTNDCLNLLKHCFSLDSDLKHIPKALRLLLFKNAHKLLIDKESVAIFSKLITPADREKTLWVLLTKTRLSSETHHDLLELMAEYSNPLILNDFLKTAAGHYNTCTDQAKEILVDNLLVFLAVHPEAPINAIDLCTLLQKQITNQNGTSAFHNALLKTCTKQLTDKNIPGMFFFRNNLSKKEYTQLKTTTDILNNRVC